jgi:hypothetical protein
MEKTLTSSLEAISYGNSLRFALLSQEGTQSPTGTINSQDYEPECLIAGQ